MADFRRGIKAGVAVAGVYLVVSVILELTGLSFQFPVITAAGLTPFSLTALTDPSFVIFSLGNHIVRGLVFGAVFAALYNYLPGVTSIVKGVVLSSFLWIVTVIQVIYTTPGWPWTPNGITGSGTYYSGTVSLSSVGLALAGIISALVFGALTGFLWDRLRGKELVEERNGRPVLLVSFILGGVLWVPMSVLFLLGVVIVGVPAVNPDMWWADILATSVVFLGLPGWVLTFVAWRKTKRGESGLKLGVAGGVIMALTGVMLLPGVLAIIGGVLSGRKPATEPSTAEIGR